MWVDHRGFYIVLVFLVIILGLMCIVSGNETILKSLVSKDAFKAIYSSSDAYNDFIVKFGLLLIIAAIVIGAFGGMAGAFANNTIIPKKIDMMKAQDQCVFLVDGQVYHKTDAQFYNLDDCSRIKIAATKNFYGLLLKKDIVISQEEKAEPSEVKEESKDI